MNFFPINHCGMYSEETLKGIERDLSKNPKARRPNTWEARRLLQIRNEMKRRGIKR